MSEKRVEFNFSGRYYDNGVSSESAEQTLIVLHGQGQLARFFIRKFEVLSSRGIRVLAPEGLSHYYLSGTSGRVGASWMTSEDRLNHIANYLQYLDAIYQLEEMADSRKKLTVLGFSQGAATACRWINRTAVKFDRLVLWAGLFPPDLDWSVGREVLKGKKVEFVYGLRDPYLSDDRFREQKELSEKLGVDPEVVTFDGEHTIDRETLERMFS